MQIFLATYSPPELRVKLDAQFLYQLLELQLKNIVFVNDQKQTRYVKHGFSWQIALFGPLAYFMRSQYLLTFLSAVGMYLTFVACGLITIVLMDLEVFPATVIGLAVMSGVWGYIGNRLSARSYVKNGWRPVGEFPADWNRPNLIPTTAADF